MPTAFCEEEDVRLALQKASSSFGSGALDSDMVQAAIEGASSWFARATNGHWYDSGGSTTLVDTSTVSASDVRLDVPSSPHRQDRMLLSDHQGARYPVTHDGPYARIKLPNPYVESITTLEVRDHSGGVEDWTAAGSDKVEGRGEDYYLQQKGQDSYGRTYLFIRAASIGPRVDYGGLLTLTYDYGLDYQTEGWDDIKRGVASLAAADLVMDDDVKTAIPNDGQLIAVETEADRLVKSGMRLLGPYLSTPTS